MEVIRLVLWSVHCEIGGTNQAVGWHCGNGQQASKVGHEQAERMGHGQCVSMTQLLILGCLKVGPDEIQEEENVPLFRWPEPLVHDNEPDVNVLNVSVFSI